MENQELRLAELDPKWFVNYDGFDPNGPRNKNPGMRYLTCVNHPTGRWLTKNPYQRSIHVIEPPEGFFPECPCPMSDLRVILEEGDEP